MRISGKITALFLLLVALIGGVLAIFVGQREYTAVQTRLTQSIAAQVQGRPDLQYAIYGASERQLQQVLSEFAAKDSVATVAVYSSAGTQLAQRDSSGPSTHEFPPFVSLRSGASVTDDTQRSVSQSGGIVPGGFLAALRGTNTVHLTTTILSALNPAEVGHTETDFVVAMTRRSARRSSVVLGYLHTVVAEDVLLKPALASVGQLMLRYLGLMLLASLLMYLVLRRMMTPLVQLKQVADSVAAGGRPEAISTRGGGEMGQIVQVFNKLVSSVDRVEKEVAVESKLLSLKVDESASKLSQRDEELSRATDQISEANERLHKLAYYDSLTALPNRTLFAEQLRLLLPLSVRSGNPVALLFLSLNQFDRINHSLGRRAADTVLTEVAKRLTGTLRSSDLVGHYTGSGPRIDVSRLGGDEFSLVLNHLAGPGAASSVARRVAEVLSAPMEIEGHELVVRASIGIAISPDDGDEVDALMRAASTAMQLAKERPKGGFELYKQEMDAGGLDQIKLESELRKAVEREQLILHYQPQVDTVDGSIIAAEALLRWEHPEFGLVPPFRFIGLAQDIGMMDELGNWVVAEACRQLVEFREQGLELPRVVINVSRLQFGEEFTEHLKLVLRESGLPAESIELGLSEEILVDNDTVTIRSLRELAELGIYLSVDNFGTTHAPLSYIAEYPFNELKIDRSFVSGCDKRSSNASLIRAIIAMSSSLNFRLVAEGVETTEEFEFLLESGVRAMQGYFFSKPVPAQDLKKLLSVPWCFMTQIQGIKFAREQRL